jgi:hypoxanthine phosphoribosyltransferase
MDEIDGDRERLSWTEFGEGRRDLARQVVDDGYEPDLVLSIARGGLLVGARSGTHST